MSKPKKVAPKKAAIPPEAWTFTVMDDYGKAPGISNFNLYATEQDAADDAAVWVADESIDEIVFICRVTPVSRLIVPERRASVGPL